MTRHAGVDALHPPALRRFLTLACLLLLLGGAGARCVPLKDLRISHPEEGLLLPQAGVLDVAGRVGTDFDPATAVFTLDGVDLADALGLAPPFADTGGVVAVGAGSVTVSGFTYDPGASQKPAFSLLIEGLPLGAHSFAVSAQRKSDAVVASEVRSVSVLGGFAEELSTTTSAGLARGPVPTGGSGFLANQTLGAAVAAPPLATAGGASLRSGHVAAVEGRIAAGEPWPCRSASSAPDAP